MQKCRHRTALRDVREPPQWLVGRARDLYRSIVIECGGVDLERAHVFGLCGFALSLEYMEVLVKAAAARQEIEDFGNQIFEWADAFLLTEQAAVRLLREVGAL